MGSGEGDSLAGNKEEPGAVQIEKLAAGLVYVSEEVVSDIGIVDIAGKKDGFATYDRFKRITPEEKAKILGFTKMRDFDTVYNLVSLFFYDIDHNADGNEIMEKRSWYIRECGIIL